jgi:hypothetical protein
MSVTHSEYWTTVADLANDLIDEYKLQNELEHVSEIDADDLIAQDMVWEAIDGHSFIIYTYKALAVLQHTDNQDAAFDNGGLNADSFADTITQMAFWAMHQDVVEKICNIIDDAPAPEDSEV